MYLSVKVKNIFQIKILVIVLLNLSFWNNLNLKQVKISYSLSNLMRLLVIQIIGMLNKIRIIMGLMDNLNILWELKILSCNPILIILIMYMVNRK